MPVPLDTVFRAIAKARTNEIIIDNAHIAHWPAGLKDDLFKRGFLRTAPDAPSTICPGCERACIMEVARLELAGARDPAHLVVCDKPEKYGVIEVARRAVEQWRMTRGGIETFLAGELRQRVRSREGARDRVRFGTSAQLGKQITLEFTTTVELLIGEERIDLVELLRWDGTALHVDHHLMQLLATNGREVPTGGKPYQKSKLAQERKRDLTTYRDKMLQNRAVQLKNEQQRWTKPRIARELRKDPLFVNISVERITRIIRTRIK